MRLVTRADWDGLVCAVVLSTVEHIEVIQFTYPKDIQDDKVLIPVDSVIANLPYHPNAALWFDHHVSEEDRGAHVVTGFKGKFGPSLSAARLIYEFYGGDAKLRQYAPLVEATDRIDSAQLTLEDVLDPSGYVLLSYTMDPRTGLKDLDREAYFLLLMDWLKTRPIEEILELPEVKHLTDRIRAEDQQFRQALLQHSRQEGNVIVTDFREVEAPAGNRFLVYTLFPEANVSARLFDSPDGQISTIAVGHSIFNRTCQTNVGTLLGEYGGGGHRGVGTAQFPKAEAEARFQEIIRRLKEAG
ncbi:MAG: exopolyphosphatase [Chloroflexi bacterium]|nr:exopolyphosphatase [Chloroflexota bacterium]